MHDQAKVISATRQYYAANASAYAARVAGLDLSVLWDKFARMLSPGMKVLDLGCGSGRDLKALTARGLKPVGVDYSVAMTELARTASGCEVIAADFRSYDLGENQYDGIWAVASLLHVPREEITGILDRLYRALRVPGVLLTSMQVGSGEQTSADGRFFQLYMPTVWDELLQRSGFQARSSSIGAQNLSARIQPEVTWFVTIGEKDCDARLGCSTAQQ